MNKNTKNILIGVIIVAVVVAIWMSSRTGTNNNPGTGNTGVTDNGGTASVPVSETVKVSGTLSKYQNAELGFSVQYPSNWQKGDNATGVQFIIPIDADQVSTVNRLEANIMVTSGKCAFPPVTTVDNRGTMKVGEMTLNTISMSNEVKGIQYYNRMYSLDKEGVCYFFTFTYVAKSPESQGLTGSNLTQAQNNNKAIKSTTDSAFTAMVKTLTFVQSAIGEEETKISPKK